MCVHHTPPILIHFKFSATIMNGATPTVLQINRMQFFNSVSVSATNSPTTSAEELSLAIVGVNMRYDGFY